MAPQRKKTNTNQLQEEEDLAARARVNTTESDDEQPKSPKDALIPTERPDGIEEMEWYGMVGFSVYYTFVYILNAFMMA